jgi:glycosyltransferase involved in cell wall biosynthesis
MLEALRRKSVVDPDCNVILFSVRRDKGPKDIITDKGGKVIRFHFNKESALSYIFLQIKFFLFGAYYLFKLRGQFAAIYTRYTISMIAPAILSLFFRRSLVFRTGPLFQSLSVYRPQTPKAFYPIIGLLFRYFCWQSSWIVVITDTVKAHIVELYPEIEKKIVVQPNGADPEKFLPMKPNYSLIGLESPSAVVGYVGYIDDHQGVQTLIEAIVEILKRGKKPPVLLVIGDGPSLVKWQAYGKELGVGDFIIWKGRVPHEEIPALIGCCTVMTLPLTKGSIDARGTSATKLFEYLSCEKNVIASRCADVQFLEDHGVGTLVPAEDSGAWANAILDHVEGRFTGTGEQARRLIVEEYSFDTVADRIVSLCFYGSK